MDFYSWSQVNFEHFISNDGIHLSERGKTGLREYLASQLDVLITSDCWFNEALAAPQHLIENKIGSGDFDARTSNILFFPISERRQSSKVKHVYHRVKRAPRIRFGKTRYKDNNEENEERRGRQVSGWEP